LINFLLQIFDSNLKVRWLLKSYVILFNKFPQTLNSSFLATLNSMYGIVVSNLTIMWTIGQWALTEVLIPDKYLIPFQ